MATTREAFENALDILLESFSIAIRERALSNWDRLTTDEINRIDGIGNGSKEARVLISCCLQSAFLDAIATESSEEQARRIRRILANR